MEGRTTYKKTRIAPTPSGFLHLGNVLSFVRTVAAARQVGAKILLRIDDLDRERVEKEYVQDIFDTLNFLELPWDEGPRDYAAFEREYSQVHRMKLYEAAQDVLKSSGAVFGCVCSRAQVLRDSVDGVYPGTCRERRMALDAADMSWRLRTGNEEIWIRLFPGGAKEGAEAENGEEAGTDRGVGSERRRGLSERAQVALPESMKDFVVRKRDGFPAYQLTSVVDDLHFGVDLVVRGEDLWGSTAAQHYLAGKLGKGREFGAIAFYHHGLLVEEDGRKLSKSAGDTSVQYLRKQGLKRGDIYTLLARMMGREGAPGRWEELVQGIDGKG